MYDLSFWELRQLLESNKKQDEFELLNTRKIMHSVMLSIPRKKGKRAPKEQDIFTLSFDKKDEDELRETADFLRQRKKQRKEREKKGVKKKRYKVDKNGKRQRHS